MSEQFVQHVLPLIVTAAVGVLSVVNTWLVLMKTHRLQRAQAIDVLRLQTEQAEKAVLVERHQQAYARWRQILFFKDSPERADGWVEFMSDMQDWLETNRLYLTEGAALAMSEAIGNRVIMDTMGSDAATAHHRTEAFKKLQQAGAAILANSPRYGLLAEPETTALAQRFKKPDSREK